MLPKIEYPINVIEIKSLGKKFNFRPILVKEEKILLIAKESQSEADILRAVRQVIQNCALDPNFDVDVLPIFELEYLFLTLRMQSIGEMIELEYHDNEDEQDYKFTISLKDIKITYPENVKSAVSVTDDIVVELRHPPAWLYNDETFLTAETASESFDRVVLAAIATIYEGETIHDATKAKPEELREFVDSLPSPAYKEIQDFLVNTPHMEYVITYKNKNGTERKIELRTLSDFFIL